MSIATESSLCGLIRQEAIHLELNGQTKQEIIDELIGMLDRSGMLLDKASVREAVIDRERKLSTGLGHGVAVPHGKTAGVKELCAAVGVRKAGVHFDSADGQPAKIFILIVSPESVSGPHIRALAQIAKFLRKKENRERILAAQSPAEVLAVFCP